MRSESGIRCFYHKLSGIRNPKCKGNFIYFVICTDLLLPLKVNFSYFEIQILMLIGIRIRNAKNLQYNPPIFGRIVIPGINTLKLELKIRQL